MVEPTWGAIIIYVIDGLILIGITLRMLSRMPVDTPNKTQPIKWAKGARYVPAEIKKQTSGFDWLSYEK